MFTLQQTQVPAFFNFSLKGMLKKGALVLFCTFLPLSLGAQNVATLSNDAVDDDEAVEETLPLSFGFISYSAALQQMPEYAIAKRNIADLRIKFDAEAKRSEEEFNKKYEEFLEGQRDFAPSILRKRQSEIQDLMEKNVAFKAEAKRLLEQAEQDAMAPVREKLNQMLTTIGRQRGYAFILNTDNDALPFIDMSQGEDVMPLCFPPQQAQ